MLSRRSPTTWEPTHSANSGQPVQMLTVTNAVAAANSRRIAVRGRRPRPASAPWANEEAAITASGCAPASFMSGEARIAEHDGVHREYVRAHRGPLPVRVDLAGETEECKPAHRCLAGDDQLHELWLVGVLGIEHGCRELVEVSQFVSRPHEVRPQRRVCPRTDG